MDTINLYAQKYPTHFNFFYIKTCLSAEYKPRTDKKSKLKKPSHCIKLHHKMSSLTYKSLGQFTALSNVERPIYIYIYICLHNICAHTCMQTVPCYRGPGCRVSHSPPCGGHLQLGLPPSVLFLGEPSRPFLQAGGRACSGMQIACSCVPKWIRLSVTQIHPRRGYLRSIIR